MSEFINPDEAEEFDNESKWDRARALRTEETLRKAGIIPTNAVLYRLQRELEDIENSGTEELVAISRSMDRLIRLIQSD